MEESCPCVVDYRDRNFVRGNNYEYKAHVRVSEVVLPFNSSRFLFVNRDTRNTLSKQSVPCVLDNIPTYQYSFYCRHLLLLVLHYQ